MPRLILLNKPYGKVFIRSLPPMTKTQDLAAVGVAFNLTLWLGFPDIYWMWWNLVGCAVAGAVASRVSKTYPNIAGLILTGGLALRFIIVAAGQVQRGDGVGRGGGDGDRAADTLGSAGPWTRVRRRRS